MKHPVITVAGIVLLLFHGWLVFSERFTDGPLYADDTIYRYPIMLTVLLLPLLFGASRCARMHMMTPHNVHDETHDDR